MNTVSPKDRITCFDILKGLGIIFVIVGHIPYDSSMASFIYSFHMPLFFLISGCLYSIKDNFSFVKHLKKLFCYVIIPYIFMVILSCLVYKNNLSLGDFIIRLLYIRKTGPNVALWFLPLYSIASLCFVGILCLNKKFSRLYIYMTIISILCTIKFQQIFPNESILMIGVLPAALGFMGIGYIFYKNKDILYENNKKYVFWVFCLGIIVYAYANISHIANITSYFYFVSASCFCYALFHIANLLNSKLLIFIGENAIWYLGFHTILISLYSQLFFKYWLSEHFSGFILYCLNIIVIIVLTTIAVWIFNKILNLCKLFLQKNKIE